MNKITNTNNNNTNDEIGEVVYGARLVTTMCVSPVIYQTSYGIIYYLIKIIIIVIIVMMSRVVVLVVIILYYCQY